MPMFAISPKPNRALGIEILEHGYRIALLARSSRGIRVVYTEETTSLEGLGTPLIVSALPSSTLVFRLSLPAMREKALQQALPFQLEPQLPFSADEAAIAHQLVERGEEMRISATVASRSDVEAHLEELNGLPEQVATPAAALAALFDYLAPSTDPQALLCGSLFAVVQGGSVLAARRCAPGELAKTAAAFAPLGYRQITLVGESDEPLPFATAPFPVGSPFAFGCDELESFAVPIGLALAALQESGMNLHPRPAFPWRRMRLRLIGYGVASLLAAASCLGWVRAQQEREELAVHAELKAISALSGRKIASVEEARRLSSELAQVRDTFPLEPDIPTASEFLAWLATHPQAGEIRVEDLRYTLVKRPTFDKPRDRYQVRIDLEFTASSSTAARAFHDALIASDPMIDSSAEVKWSAQRDRYRAIFFLRDRTRYSGGKK